MHITAIIATEPPIEAQLLGTIAVIVLIAVLAGLGTILAAALGGNR